MSRPGQTLIDYACLHDAKALRILGRRILAVAAPEVAEAHEARQLEQEEAAAAEATRFSMSDDGHGKVHGRFTIPTLYGEMLKKALQAIAAPKHQAATQDSTQGGWCRSRGRRRSGWARRSASTSSVIRPTASPEPAAWPRRWW